MSSLGLFSVQPVFGAGSNCVTVEAQGPLQAGELVLSERLALFGEVARAKIWFLKDDWTPESVVLYSAAHRQALG